MSWWCGAATFFERTFRSRGLCLSVSHTTVGIPARVCLCACVCTLRVIVCAFTQASAVRYEDFGYARGDLAPPVVFAGDSVRAIGYPSTGHLLEHVDMYMVRLAGGVSP